MWHPRHVVLDISPLASVHRATAAGLPSVLVIHPELVQWRYTPSALLLIRPYTSTIVPTCLRLQYIVQLLVYNDCFIIHTHIETSKVTQVDHKHKRWKFGSRRARIFRRSEGEQCQNCTSARDYAGHVPVNISCYTLLGWSILWRAVIILDVAVLTAAGRLVRDFSPVAVLVGFVVDDLFATVWQTDSVLAPGDGILVSFAPRLLVAVIVDVELERIVVPSLRTYKLRDELLHRNVNLNVNGFLTFSLAS